jgi:hypothetical protein
MADETGPAIVSFVGGFPNRVETTLRESGQATLFNVTSVDAGPLGTGATVTGSQTTQLNGYQIQAANTWFATVAAGGACILPQTNRPFPFTGLVLYIANTGANNVLVFPHPADTGNSINGQGANTSVILIPNSITPFQCFTPGIWFADGIGEGQAGSLTTTGSQGSVAASGTTAANSTLITQAMLNVTATATTQGVTLPPAKAGLSITMNGAGGGSASFLVWPGVAGTDSINALSAGTSYTFANPSTTGPTIFFCFNNSNWQTK